jgi:hypothetical protein
VTSNSHAQVTHEETKSRVKETKIEEREKERARTVSRTTWIVHYKLKGVQFILVLRPVEVNTRQERITRYQCCASTRRIGIESEGWIEV